MEKVGKLQKNEEILVTNIFPFSRNISQSDLPVGKKLQVCLSFYHSIFKNILPHDRTNRGLLGKAFTSIYICHLQICHTFSKSANFKLSNWSICRQQSKCDSYSLNLFMVSWNWSQEKEEMLVNISNFTLSNQIFRDCLSVRVINN